MLRDSGLSLAHAVERRAACAALPLLLLGLPRPPRVAASVPPEAFSGLAASASKAFEAARYGESEALWRKVTESYPSESLGWANLATVLIINASDGGAVLGSVPIGRALDQLEEALRSIDRAEGLGSAGATADALLLNSRGNARALLQQWPEAQAAYSASATVAPRDLESIPASNEALAFIQLEQPGRAEKIARRILRRDPIFADAHALLATARWLQGDAAGAAEAIGSGLCGGLNGAMWCTRYADERVVLGRWSPRAVEAYRELLKQPAVKLELKNGQMMGR
jgi:tetratricopeptide (TPR) repeat protein